ncbi:hypothetical protein, variant [Phytophthora nicotianae INRA-310]|uniref:Secreted protein n=1 Tax=Phytophthora nicotianae (strain INRA-310) TaxID=761204 RepID=W2PMQ1_PHYN3|nr:hypothetical protein PPTG_16967 [Phytophthora nicotianae INRA-310]XP_008912798.1 hypothetical protein, variant [Phytophthora nicotianae INRA-310]ETN01896.1 hypothetical protein PPTG_16967 [Phytophthora nicotianae INRA-310]ETN01897.1 hypothetical protein, variant [Phytophthora nicotianae INRA-310]
MILILYYYAVFFRSSCCVNDVCGGGHVSICVPILPDDTHCAATTLSQRLVFGVASSKMPYSSYRLAGFAILLVVEFDWRLGIFGGNLRVGGEILGFDPEHWHLLVLLHGSFRPLYPIFPLRAALAPSHLHRPDLPALGTPASSLRLCVDRHLFSIPGVSLLWRLWILPFNAGDAPEDDNDDRKPVCLRARLGCGHVHAARDVVLVVVPGLWQRELLLQPDVGVPDLQYSDHYSVRRSHHETRQGCGQVPGQSLETTGENQRIKTSNSRSLFVLNSHCFGRER